MLNSIHRLSNQFIPVFQEKISYALNDTQKRVATIALIAVTVMIILANCYIRIQHYRGLRRLEVKVDPTMDNKKAGVKIDPPMDDKKADVKIDPPMDDKKSDLKIDPPMNDAEEIKACYTAMELMFEHRVLEWGVSLLPRTVEAETERYETLKKAILVISSKNINRNITYRDGMAPRQQTLLLQAIMCIADPVKRLEIVKMLLAQGANPVMQGEYYSMFVDPLEEAKKTKDVELINCISASIDIAKLKATSSMDSKV